MFLKTVKNDINPYKKNVIGILTLHQNCFVSAWFNLELDLQRIFSLQGGHLEMEQGVMRVFI